MRLVRKKKRSFRTSAFLRRPAPRAAVAVLSAAGLVALGATGTAHAATAPKWTVAYRTHGGPSQAFDGITAPTKSDAWAVGSTAANVSVFAHWNGRSWTPESIRPASGLLLSSAYSASPSDVWLVGVSKKTGDPWAVIYNGKAWRARALPFGFDSEAVAVLSLSDVWAVLGSACGPAGGSQTCTVLAHWNGSKWSDVKVAGIEAGMTAAGGHAWIWTLSSGGGSALYEASGNKVSKVKAPPVKLSSAAGIVAARNGQLWAIGTLATKKRPAVLLHWTGHSWTQAAIPGNVPPPGATGYWPVNLTGSLSWDGKNGFWCGWFLHWTGKQWVNTDINFGGQFLTASGWGEAGVATAIPGTDGVWGVGEINRGQNGTPTDGLIAVEGPRP